MAAEIVGTVGSALAQEGVSGVSSYISGKLEEKASRAHTVARLEMALSQLEFALERAGKLPITYVSLLRRMKMLKRAYLQGTDLLNKHKLVAVDDAEADQGIFRRAAANLSISSLLGLRSNDDDGERLTSSVAKTFEWYAACADKLVADVVESSSPLRRDNRHALLRRYPLLRHLLEGKTLRYETSSSKRGGRQEHHSLCAIWPVRLEERGVEARLMYQYLDKERPERRFRLRLMLRLSEDTDIVGVAVKCLRALAAQFKLAAASSSAAGELALLPHCLSDDDDDMEAHSSYGPPLDWSEESYAAQTKSWRPDPTCCTGVNASPPHGVPEPVIAVGFGCYVSAPEYNDVLAAASSGSSSSSSSSLAANDAVVVAGARNAAAPPLYLVAAFVPHHHRTCATVARGIVLTYGGREECLGGGDSVQHVKEVLRSKAIVDCVVGQIEPADYDVSCYAPAWFRVTLRKASDELAWTWTEPPAAPVAARSGRGAGKRKR